MARNESTLGNVNALPTVLLKKSKLTGKIWFLRKNPYDRAAVIVFFQ